MTDTKRKSSAPGPAPGPITLSVPAGEVPQSILDAKAALEAAGHVVDLVPADAPGPSNDPFAGVDLDTVPPAVWTALGISRLEVERNRQAPPAVAHGHRGLPAETPLEDQTAATRA